MRLETWELMAELVEMVDVKLLQAAKAANCGANGLKAARAVAKCVLLLPG